MATANESGARTRGAVLVPLLVLATLAGLLALVLLTIGQIGAPRPPAESTLAYQPAAMEAPVPAARRRTTLGGGPRQVSPEWVRRTSSLSGIPATAIAAYGNATLAAAREQPSCHLGWSTLAGIGTIESANGTIGDRSLLPSGLSSRPIAGPALNGAGGYAAIESASGEWSSALGPMQFIPSTWARWGADATGDGVADINNIFDSSLAAARYLCADGHDLATAQGWMAAVLSYNHSSEYVQEVYAAAVAAMRKS